MAILYNAFELNGVIDTSQDVMQNLDKMCTSCCCWLSFDVNTGLWSVTINKEGTSVKTFNDNNIIGGINVSGTGIDQMYNAVSVTFPHADMKSQDDVIEMKIPDEEKFINEQEKVLNMSLDLTNDPVQAQYIAGVELKQTRLDKTITFKTDYSSLGLKGGDIIDITTDEYGFTGKLFRVTKVTEEDTDEGTIVLTISAIEYDPGTYTDDLIKVERNKKTGVVPKSYNAPVRVQDGWGCTCNYYAFGTGTIDLYDFSDNNVHEFDSGFSFTIEEEGLYQVRYQINWGGEINYQPPLGIHKNTRLKLYVNGAVASQYDLTSSEYTGDRWSPLMEDHTVVGLYHFNLGDVLDFKAEFVTNYPLTYNAAYFAQYAPGYPVYTVNPAETSLIVWNGEVERFKKINNAPGSS